MTVTPSDTALADGAEPSAPPASVSGPHRLLTRADEVALGRRMEAGRYAEHLLAGGSVPGCGADREELRWLVEDGLVARQAFIEANLRLVHSVVRKYATRGLSADDVTQDGFFGLVKAVDRYDFAKGTKFSTYATWWIRQAIIDGLNQVAQVHRPEAVEQGIRKVRAVSSVLEGELGREPTLAEIAARAEVSEMQVRRFLWADKREVSLDLRVGDEASSSLGDLLPDHGAHARLLAVEADADTATLHEVLDGLFALLTTREVEVVRMRFGLGEPRPLTLDEVADRLGVSRNRVRQIEMVALSRLRRREVKDSLASFLRPVA